MLCKDYISNETPVIHLNETIEDVLHHTGEVSTAYYIVEDNDKYIGLLNGEDFLSFPKDTTISHFSDVIIKASVRDTQHIFSAFQVMHQLNISLVPIVNTENDLLGEITEDSLLDALSLYLGLNEAQGGMIVLEVNPLHYSIAEIIQIVQSGNADIMQYNTRRNASNGNIEVSFIINKPDVSLIVATLQRYEYNILYYFGDESYDNELKTNYDLLMRYMNI